MIRDRFDWERKPLACSVRRPAERKAFRGKLPRTTGWQPVLPGENHRAQALPIYET
jgi:hypothetical protein